MKASKFINSFLISFIFIYSPLLATAAPSTGIRTLLNTPASTFDVFLHQLYIAANGSTFFGGSTVKEQIRIFSLDYDYESNLISMGFHIGPDHKLMRGFGSRDTDGKKEMLLRAAKEIATSLGLDTRTGGNRFGLIQHLKIRNGWATSDFDEAQLKDEIVSRTIFELVYAYEEKIYYQVRRDQTGRYQFSMDTKKINF